MQQELTGTYAGKERGDVQNVRVARARREPVRFQAHVLRWPVLRIDGGHMGISLFPY